MTADNHIEIILTEDLTTGEVSIKSNKALSYSAALHIYLVALKGLKDQLVNNVSKLDKDRLIKLAYGDNCTDTILNQIPEDESVFKEDILTKMEGEMYDILNLAVGNFLDSEFPRVNARPSLTEEAAAAAGLDKTATDDELVQAEIDFINSNPELAAECADMQPTEVKGIVADECH